MSKLWKPEDRIFLIKVFFIGFTLILLSKLGEHYWSPDFYPVIKTIVTLFLKESGVAVMIAAVLGYTVEARSRAKQAEEVGAFTQRVSEDVLSAVFKKIIPDSIFDEVKRTVLDETLLKKDSSLHYDLRTIDDKLAQVLGLSSDEAKRLLVCQITTSHTLVNLGDNKIPNHVVKFGVSCDLSRNLMNKIEIHSARLGEEMSNEDLAQHIDDGKGRGVKEFSKNVTLGPKEELVVSFCATTFKRIEDTEVWTTLKPTENMELTVTHPPEISVGAKSLHSRPAEKQPINPKACRVEYKLNHGVFPYQGMTFWWHKAE